MIWKSISWKPALKGNNKKEPLVTGGLSLKWKKRTNLAPIQPQEQGILSCDGWENKWLCNHRAKMYLCGINKIKEYSVTDNVIFICCTGCVVQGKSAQPILSQSFSVWVSWGWPLSWTITISIFQGSEYVVQTPLTQLLAMSQSHRGFIRQPCRIEFIYQF